MEFKIIKYNFHKKVRRTIFLSIIIFLIIIGVSLKIYNYEFIFLKWIFILLLSIWIIHSLAIKTYNVIGLFVFKSNEIIIKNKDQVIQFDHSQIVRFIFHYGGYKGEMREFEIFITGIGSRDGTKNFITINEIPYQVLLENKSKLEFIKNYLNDLNKKKIKTQFIKKY